MRASWRTAWQGHEIVVFRDDAEADRFDAEQIQRVMLVHRADRRDRISRLIAGNSHPRCSTYGYLDADDLAEFVARSVEWRT